MKNINRWNKSRINYIHFNYNDFCDYDNFLTELLQVLQENVQYSLLLKIKFNKTQYAMSGDQLGLLYEKDMDLNVFEYIHRVYMKRISNLSDDYNVEEINSLQLLFVRIEDMPQLKIENLNKVDFKTFAGKRDSKSRFTFIPLTVNADYFGKLILKDRELYLSIINKNRVDLNQNKLVLDEISSMYLYGDYIIINSVKDGIIFRDVYDSVSGLIISKIQDKVIGDNMFTRKIGNNSLTVLNDKIVNIESSRNLSSINYKPRPLKDEPNTLIGSWDIEAFKDSDGYAKVYALGFYVLNGKVNTYYLENGITSDDLVLKCIDDMLVNEYKGYTFYTHNLGRYDATFLVKILKDFNVKVGYEHYILNAICRDNKPLKLTIKVKKSLSDRNQSKIGARRDPGFNSITIVDSLNLLNQSLDALCESFGVEVVKGSFPHKFVKRNTLNYVGNTPRFDYWSNISLKKYEGFVKPDWNLKEECLKYLEKDLISLTMIMHKFSEYINRKHNLQVTDSLTISRLALNIFLKEYLKDSKLPIIGKNMFSDIKEAYYGGITEVYKPYGKNLFYYDVNSLYPFAALNSMPGNQCTFIENIDGSASITDLFGFFYCEIDTNNGYLGLLPVHHKEGLIMPHGSWKGWYFSEELKYALSQGYNIKVIKGYKFNKLEGVFSDYVNDLYKVKSTTKDMVEKDINKRLLNHLLGRFGMNIEKPITELMDGDKFSLIESSRKTLGEPRVITDDDYWVTYYPEVDADICKSHGLDYFKVCNLDVKIDTEISNEFKDVSLTTAAAVTAYARVYMSKVKMDILNKGGDIYYTDTDSIVTNIVLDENLVGTGLGQFKLEHKIKRGYFISNKTYCLQLFDKLYDKAIDTYKDTVIKAKSVDSKSLSLDSFKELYNGISIKATKRFAVTDHNKGSVLIVEDPNVNLNHDSYTKREKIFKRSKWIDTKPLILKSSFLDIKPSKLTKSSKKGKSSGIVKKSKPLFIEESSEISKPLIENTVKNAKVNYVKLGSLKNNKVYLFFTNVYRCISDVFYYISMILYYFLTILGCIMMLCILISLLSLCFVAKVEAINDELEQLLESRYLDDYMEEPVEIEIFESSSYWHQIKGCLNNYINLFLKSSSEYHYFHRYHNNPQFVTENVTNEFPQTAWSESLMGHSPDVLNSVLKHHLESSVKEYNQLNDKLSISEFERVKRDNLVWEALIMCKKALQGESYESPIVGYNSPMVGPNRNSMLEYEGRFRINSSIINSPVLNSPVVNSSVANSVINNSVSGNHQTLINDITTLLNSPNFSYSPTLSNNSPIFTNNSPNIGNNSTYLDTAPFSRNSLFTRVNTPVSGNSPITGNTPILSNTPFLVNSPVWGNIPDGGNTFVSVNTHNGGNIRLNKLNLVTTDNSTIGAVDSLGLKTLYVENKTSISTSSLTGHNRFDSVTGGMDNQIESSNRLMNNQNITSGTQYNSSITKAPLREIYSPNTLRRFGHVWSDNTSIWDYKPMKRYGGTKWVSPELD